MTHLEEFKTRWEKGEWGEIIPSNIDWLLAEIEKLQARIKELEEILKQTGEGTF